MVSLVNISFSSTSFVSRRTLSFSPSSSPSPSSLASLFKFNFAKKIGYGGESLMLRVKCSPESARDTESEPETPPSSSSASSTDFSTYSWYAGLGGVGFSETSYLTYLKLTDSEAFCPVGGGTCSDILNSDYALVFGVPLPVIGMFAYGLVATLGLQVTQKKLTFGLSEADTRVILLGITTAMAAASAYFLYILTNEFPGASCSYCLMSALLSFSLFFITLKMFFLLSIPDFHFILLDFGFQEIQKVVWLPLCVTALVIASLTASYNDSPPVLSSSAEIDIPLYTTEVTTDSSPLALSLARHLRSIGAKMYGAFWCSHCLEQKEMFGSEAAKLLDYVECFPDGYRKGEKIAKPCAEAGIEGFPTWVINGQVLSGEQTFLELAQASGFNVDNSSQPN
ncbi:Vitamin K epoxide reductase [Dillenia turbinata]|uniref:Vitamin K epoxide reductase n=1 Tax=Dillenia turbinata TaxID=194707 RepID=A0AAN8VLX0_9MAGN